MAEVAGKTKNTLLLFKPKTFSDLKIGMSICVSGACLSVTEYNDQILKFDVMEETWEKTKLGSLKQGDKVNLERALPVSGRFDGHIVQGHVEGVGEVIKMKNGKMQCEFTINIASGLAKYVVSKGSIAIDGVSLTVAELAGDCCRVALIPYTMENTTLGSLKAGERVNVETDILGRYFHAIIKKDEKSR